jgi:hypothetical protein
MLRDALLALALATGFVFAAHIAVWAVTHAFVPEQMESGTALGQGSLVSQEVPNI